MNIYFKYTFAQNTKLERLRVWFKPLSVKWGLGFDLTTERFQVWFEEGFKGGFKHVFKPTRNLSSFGFQLPLLTLSEASGLVLTPFAERGLV